MLSLHNLRNVLQYRIKQMESNDANEEKLLGFHCFFFHADIYEATTLDPFMHVYMYDIGFPPKLIDYLSDIFNWSSSAYLICYHPPNLMIDQSEFNIVRMPAKHCYAWIWRESSGIHLCKSKCNK